MVYRQTFLALKIKQQNVIWLLDLVNDEEFYLSYGHLNVANMF